MDCDDHPTPYTPDSLADELAPLYASVVRMLKDAISRGSIMTVKALIARFPASHTPLWDSEELCDPTPYTQCMQGGHFGVLEHLYREDLVDAWVFVKPLARTLCGTAVNVERVIQFMEAVRFDTLDVVKKVLPACVHAPGLELLKYVIHRFKITGQDLARAGGPLVRAAGRLDVVAYLCPMVLGSPSAILADLADTGELCVVQHVCEHFKSMGRKDGLSLLQGAARGGQVTTMIYVHSKFKLRNVSTQEDLGLVGACAGGHVDAVKFLCDTFKLTAADVERGDGAALQAAAAGGHLAVVEYLCKTYELTAGRGAFVQAVQRGHLAVAEALHKHKLTPTQPPLRASTLATLPTACELGNAGLVRFICERFHPTLQDVKPHINRALAAAAALGRLDIVTYLCERLRLAGEDDGVWGGALWAAAGAGHLAVVQHVRSHFALEPRDLCTKRSRAMRRAAKGGHLAVVVYLCVHGAPDCDVAARALRVATQGGHLNVARYLCDRFALPPDTAHEGLCGYMKLAAEYADAAGAATRSSTVLREYLGVAAEYAAAQETPATPAAAQETPTTPAAAQETPATPAAAQETPATPAAAQEPPATPKDAADSGPPDTPAALTPDDVSALQLLDLGAAPSRTASILTPRMERIRDALGARMKRKRVSVDLTRQPPVELPVVSPSWTGLAAART